MKRKPLPGRWYIEDAKGVKLYCVGITGDRVDLSHRPDRVVLHPLQDYDIFFTLVPKTIVEDQSKNGVRVIVTRSKNGSTVDASCSCFGSDMRAHSTESCPNRKRKLRGYYVSKTDPQHVLFVSGTDKGNFHRDPSRYRARRDRRPGPVRGMQWVKLTVVPNLDGFTHHSGNPTTERLPLTERL